ncbi:MAG: uracil-DNA glycosylase [Bacilli bacterium]|nr:uracil-DNA glycosylase [Bacilli bacterium]
MKKAIVITFSVIWLGFSIYMIPSFFVDSFKEVLGNNYDYFLLAYAIFTACVIIYFLIFLYRYEVGAYDDVSSLNINLGFKRRNRDSGREVFSDVERAEYLLKKASIQPNIVYTDKKLDPTTDLTIDNSEDPIQSLLNSKLSDSAPKPVIEVGNKEVKSQIENDISNISEDNLAIKENLTLDVTEEEKELIQQIVEDNPEKTIKITQNVNSKIVTEDIFEFEFWSGLKFYLPKDWEDIFNLEKNKQYFSSLSNFIKEEYDTKKVYPDKEEIFKAFQYTSFSDIKVVIIGKIPFYRKNQADGLAFSTRNSAPINQTTQIIINEAMDDVGISNPDSGSLVNWAKQGVFLLNSALSAPSDKPANHLCEHWKIFTDNIISILNEDKRPKVFVLWGEHAKEFEPLINQDVHLVITATNPSPLSASKGFYGSKPFTKINEFLKEKEINEINWELKE